MIIFVRQLPPDKKLVLYKKVKGYYLHESGGFNLNNFAPVMNEKIEDVQDILDYDFVDYMEVYRDYSYGRY